MSSMAHTLGLPVNIRGVGNIYPIRLCEWEDFEKVANILLISKEQLKIKNDEISLLDLLVLSLGSEDENVVKFLCEVFRLVTRTEEFNMHVVEGDYFFSSNDDSYFINRDNYDEIRKTIMNQNLLFEPKVYSDPILQEWAEMALKARNKGGLDCTLEDMITTVQVVSCKHPWDIAEYTMFQLKGEFTRILKIKNYDTQSILFANPYASDVKLEHFAEKVDMLKSPYEDVFVNSDKKLSKLNNSLK